MNKMIIFDMDGVLVDACDWHRIALNKALKEICNYEISLEDHYSVFNGLPTKVKLSKLAESGLIENSKIKEIYEKKQEITINTINKEATLRNEKINMIETLKDEGFYVTCFTNSIRKTAELMLEKIGVLSLLDCLLTNQDVKCSKPDPEGYLFLINKFKVDKQNAIIVEDSPKGLKAAFASGCNVIAVKNPDEVDIKIFKEYL